MLIDGRRATWDSACALFDDLDEFPPPFLLLQHDTDAYNHLREHVNDTTTDFQNELPTLQRLLWQFRDVWLPQNWKPGTCNIIAHHIVLNDPRPIVVRPKHYTEEQQEVIIAETESMLRDGIIEHSNSPYAFEPSLVMKPDGRWRFCVNYQRLNNITTRDNYPFPRIVDILKSFKDKDCFSKMDIRAGFWNIPLDEASRPYTAFRTPLGLFQFRVMPFGLVNSPATFQRATDQTLLEPRRRGVRVYIDDIGIPSYGAEENLNLLYEVLTCLRNQNFRVFLRKSGFLKRKEELLGHVISKGEACPNPRKVSCLRDIRLPSDVKEVRKILGTLSYFRRYIPNFAEYAAVINPLLRKETPFSWSPSCQQAVEDAVKSLATAVIHLLLTNDPLVLECDASYYAVGAVLSIRHPEGLRPVEFASICFKKAELNWTTTEKEAYAIFWALQHFDNYLRGRTFDVYTDHEALVTIKNAGKGKLSR